MARVDVVMPKMGESVMEGTVLEWKKAAGDTVELDETLLEISTDKVDSEIPSPSAGRLVEILVKEGDTVEVGTPIAVIESDVNAAVSATPPEAPPADAPAVAGETSVAEAAQPLDTAQPVGEEPDEEPVAKPAEPPMRPREEAPAAASAASGGDGMPAGGGTPPAAAGQAVEVVMPKMGESVMEGTVLGWKKAVGDTVELDETLLEISTDKVDSEIPSPTAGVLAEILVQEGETVDVGTPIAVIAAGAPTGAPSPAPSAPAAPAPASAPVTPSPAEKSYGGPASTGDGSPSLTTGSAPLAAPAAAQVAEAVPAGPSPAEAGPLARRGESGRFYSPLVRSIAEKEGLSMQELEAIAGTGSEGRVTKKDMMAHLESRAARPQPAAPALPASRVAPERPATPARPAAAPPSTAADGRVEVVEMDRMRQLIAEHMTRSKATSAHVTSFTEVDMTGLVQHRERHKTDFEKREGVKLTFTPYFLLAAIEPLREHPWLNASVEGSRILVRKDFHIGIAVAIGTRGLLVPVVRNAGEKNLTGLARAVADLAERTRSKGLQPDELQGGTFTLTNVGSLGSLMGTPIINQPQVAILSPGAIVKRPVVVEHPTLGDIIAVRQMMYVSLSYDHRIVDGAMAASFLRAYRERLEAVTPESELF